MKKTVSLTNQQVTNAFHGYNYMSRKEVNGKLVFALASLGAQLRRIVLASEALRDEIMKNADLDEIMKNADLDEEAKNEAVRLISEDSVDVSFTPIPKAELEKYDFASGAIESLLPFIDVE